MNESEKYESMKAEVSYLSMASCIHRFTGLAIRSAIDALHIPQEVRDLMQDVESETMRSGWQKPSPLTAMLQALISHKITSCAKPMTRRTDMAERVVYQYGDLNVIPFEDDAFDWAWCADVLWHRPELLGLPAKNPLSILKELVWVVKPGES